MKKTSVQSIVLFVLCVALALVILVPFLIMFLNSFKGIRESALFELSWTSAPTWENYQTVINNRHFWRGLMNSFLITACSTVLVNLFSAMAAFIIQRRKDKWTSIAYFLLFTGLIIPVSIIPTIRLMMTTHVHNTYLGIILFYCATNFPFAVFILTGFMKSVPREMDEAALIEGASFSRLFFTIILPLLKTALVTNSIVTITNVWNDFNAPFYLISDSHKWPIVISIYNFVSRYYTNWGTVFAFMGLVILPVLILYAFLQRHIIAGLTSGAVKG